jgi:hypothetical protein
MKRRADVTDVTAFSHARWKHLPDNRNAGNIGYTPGVRSLLPGRHSLPWITSPQELATALRYTPSAESKLRGVLQEVVLAEREKMLALGVPANLFLRKWRSLNTISVAAYSRLTGTKSSQIWRALKAGDVEGVIEPITAKLALPLWLPLAEGFSYNEVLRATAGEPVHLTRQLYGRRDQRP